MGRYYIIATPCQQLEFYELILIVLPKSHFRMPPLPLPELLTVTFPGQNAHPSPAARSATPVIALIRCRLLKAWGACSEIPQDGRPLRQGPLRLVASTERPTSFPASWPCVLARSFDVMIGAVKGSRPHDQPGRLSRPIT